MSGSSAARRYWCSIIYTGLPQLGLVRFSVIEAAVIGLALNEAAYLSEILRGGILSVAKGQTEAARALGLKPYQIFRKVVMPQALRVIIPPLGNSVNGLLKTTSIASVISMEEVLRRGQILMQQKFQVLEVFMVVAIIYLVMTTCWDFVQRRIEAYYGKAYGAAVDTQLARDDH
jgi:polar amino acid transport system permease protein